MVLFVLPNLVSIIDPAMSAQLTGESKLFTFFSQFDLLQAGAWLMQLVRG